MPTASAVAGDVARTLHPSGPDSSARTAWAGTRPELVALVRTTAVVPGSTARSAWIDVSTAGGYVAHRWSVLTRYIAVPWAGTEAAIRPAVSRSSCAHRSRTRYAAASGSPVSAAEVSILAVRAVSLNSATARSPFSSGFTNTCVPSSERIGSPCTPSRSWSTAITSRLPRISIVSGVASRRSLPISSGAAMTDHRLKWLRYSRSVMPPLPTSSMSGSFQWPGPAYSASTMFCLAMLSMLPQVSLMSPVVRHRWPTSFAHSHGSFWPHSQML